MTDPSFALAPFALASARVEGPIHRSLLGCIREGDGVAPVAGHRDRASGREAGDP